MSENPDFSPEEEEAPYKPVTRSFIFFMLRTRRGLYLMDKFGKWRFQKPLGWIMLAIMPVAALMALYVIGLEVTALYFSPQSAQIVSNIRTISPLANFLLPGLNPYLPLSVWLAVVVAVVIHESSHGIIARSLGLRVKSAGVLLLAILPIGAFVELDDKQLRKTKSRDSLRVLGAGSGINFIVGIACILLLLLTVSTMVPAVKGAAIEGVVSPTSALQSPAFVDGIKPGDFVTAIDNTPVTDLSVIHNGTFSIGEKVNVTIWRDGKTSTIYNMVLANYTSTTINETSGKSTSVSYPFLGVQTVSYSDLQSLTSDYYNLYKITPLEYVVSIPTFGNAQYTVPFSDIYSPFYTSVFGSATAFATQAFFWLFFVNFNLAIFNSLPIYPMDGGQAFESFLRGAGRGRISDELAKRLTTGLTVALFFALFALIAGPYLGELIP